MFAAFLCFSWKTPLVGAVKDKMIQDGDKKRKTIVDF